MTNQILNFTTLRPPQNLNLADDLRFISDARIKSSSVLLEALENTSKFEDKIKLAFDYIKARSDTSTDQTIKALYFSKEKYYELNYNKLVEYLRVNIKSGADVSILISELMVISPILSELYDEEEWTQDFSILYAFLSASIWNTLYVNVILGCVKNIETNYIIDALRVLRILTLLKSIQTKSNVSSTPAIWKIKQNFDDFEVLISDRLVSGVKNIESFSNAFSAYKKRHFRELDPCDMATPLLTSCLKPLYVGDLMVIEKELCKYDLGEIAAIENIMAKEKRDLVVKDLSKITEYTETLSDIEKEDASSSIVDERYQFDSQTSKAQQSDLSLSGSVTGNYKFPAGDVSVSASASYNNSKQTSYDTSTQYAKNITEEASKSVKQHIKEVKKLTIVTQHQRKQSHEFDNKDNTNHVVGIYRWVDKIYNAQMFDYGKRLFFEVWVPEPAHFLKELKNSSTLELEQLMPPVHPRDSVHHINEFDKINENNYMKICNEYDVVDFEIPPPKEIYKSISVAVPGEETVPTALTDHADKLVDGVSTREVSIVKKVTDLKIDDGYFLKQAGLFVPLGKFMKEALRFNKDHNNSILVTIGNKSIKWNMKHGDQDFNKMHDIESQIEQGNVPILIIAEFEGMLGFNVKCMFERKTETLLSWQKETYARLLEGYDRKHKEYLQKKRELEIKQNNKIEKLIFKMRDSAYRNIESQELKKHCIDIFSAHTAFTWYSDTTVRDIDPRIDIVNSNKRKNVVEFFEDSFEWDQISYKFFPYFWADNNNEKKRWSELYQEVETGNELHDQFLKAGFAKVIIPIKPNFEENILFFLETHQVWKGGKLPVINNETYKSYLNELHDSKQLKKGSGIAVGDIWEIKLPTSFVILQNKEDGTPDDQLPTDLCRNIVNVPEDESIDIENLEIDTEFEDDLEDVL